MLYTIKNEWNQQEGPYQLLTRMWRSWNSTLLVGASGGYIATLENSLRNSQKVSIPLPHDPEIPGDI